MHTTLLILGAAATLLSSCLCDSGGDGDFVNQFVAYVKGDEQQVGEVVSFLKKRSAVSIISTMNSDAKGRVILFSHNDVHSRSKRSSEDHYSITDLSSHPYIYSIEQQTELIREKRDYYDLETAKRLVEEYRRLLLEERHSQAKSPETTPAIQHDKQNELEEPQFYEDKNVYKRYRPLEGDDQFYSKTLDSRDYDPNENRTINLNDEHWPDQWYLNNDGQAGGPKGMDINVVPAWQQGYSGKGIAVCVLDDGIEHTHDDLKDNYWAEISSDFNSRTDTDPMPNQKSLDENSHGTRCAGEIAAKANNTVCGVGVAFNSRIGGLRLLDGIVTDSLEGAGLLFQNQLIDIYSASWGPRDNGKVMEAPGPHCSRALEQGAKEGRNGKGSIYVWATGNGGVNGDDCSADGYVSSPYTLSIGSINNYAESTYFMEWCPSTLAVIYTGGYHSKEQALHNNDRTHPLLKVVTTNVRNTCTLNFQGTSSAAPLAAGVMALTLEANPDLTWRDIQHIVVLTSKIPNSIEPGWTINGAGLHINDKFGYGSLDASQMVQVAQTWDNVGPQHSCSAHSILEKPKLFDNSEPLTVTLETDGCQKSAADAKNRVDKLEHVQMHIKLDTPRRGNIKLTLISPAGTRSEMLSPRRNDDSVEGIDFTFMTVRNWNEIPRGTWTLIVTDTGKSNRAPSKLHRWSLTLLGTVQKTSTRDTESVSGKKAFNPNHKTLDEIMDMESGDAVNVKIKKGSETDVIKNFASNKVGNKPASEKSSSTESENESKSTSPADEKLKADIERMIQGMPKDQIEEIIDSLRGKVKIAKREREERLNQELYKRVEEFLDG